MSQLAFELVEFGNAEFAERLARTAAALGLGKAPAREATIRRHVTHVGRLNQMRTSTTIAICLALASSVGAQKLERDFLEDPRHGFRFRPLSHWAAQTVRADEVAEGLLYRFSYGSDHGSGLEVWNFDAPWFTAKGELMKEAKGALLRAARAAAFDRVRELGAPDLEETEPFAGVDALHQRWNVQDEVWLDVWSVSLDASTLALVFILPSYEKPITKAFKAFRRSAATLERIERIEFDLATSSYEELMAYHAADLAALERWRVVPTPSKKYILKTSHDDDGFLEDVILRLERSREIFERDFPPPPDFSHVSVVRVCRSATEFHEYGGTSQGVVGWFNPSSTELVLYDAQETNRNITFSVMTHEAFHQYCFFLFERAEAHRWFDEGHGDYYGGIQWSVRGKPVVKVRMPGGLSRVEGVRAMVRDGSYAPMADHLNYSHREWQNQKPTRVSGYEQSWSIIYMLRQGTLGDVHRKVWRKEYATIVPNYVSALRDGFAKAFQERRAELEEEAREDGTPLTEKNLDLQSRKLSTKRKRVIWQAAYEASWGRIDLEQFEADWKVYVKKYLK